MLVDVHAHLDDRVFAKDLAEVIGRAEAAGVGCIVSNGLDVESNRKTLEISKEFKIVRPALGFYPGLAQKASEEVIGSELEFIRESRPFAIGEVGLDFYHEHDKLRQREIFLKFISLAEHLRIPLIVHSRKAEADVLDMLASSNARKVVLHCFTGKVKLAKAALEMGFMFSIPPVIVSSSQFQNLVSNLPVESLLTETDSPYLSSVRGERNEPVNVNRVVKKISEIKNLDENRVKEQILANFGRFF